MTRPNLPIDRTADALECFLCLMDPDADPRSRARWTAWLGENPENRAAYHAVRDTWSQPVPGDVWPTHEEVTNDTYDGEIPMADEIARRKREARGPGGSGRVPATTRAFMLASAALLVAVLGFGASRLWEGGAVSPEATAYRTGRGEQQRIALADGSTVTLGPVSELRVDRGGSRRQATLMNGEAIFNVVHDGTQPFKVFALSGEVQDVGTAFSVAIRADRVTVTVVEGAVAVSPQRVPDRSMSGVPSATQVTLRHDQQVSYSAAIGSVTPVDARLVTGWSHGRLAYLDQPLEEVVADLSRFTTRDIAIADPKVGALRYTGTVETDALDQWAASLTRVYPVRADTQGTGLILHFAPKD
jgi:transmembrane sensor